MDGATFDRLSRRIASLGTRRQAVKALTGAVVAAVAGGRAAAAQSCTAQYRPCQTDGQCCAGAVCQSGICQPGCRIDGVFRSASTPQPGNTCARCTPAVSTTTWSPANEGMSCWSGNLCGGASTCQSGACQPTTPTVCQPLTACHEAGECNPGTGLCSNPPAPAGTPCGGGASCNGGLASPGLTCNGSGACTGGQTVACAPYACGETACRTTCDIDEHCGTGAACRQSECVYLRANGESCPADHHCASGHCVEGICCDTACESLCDVCGTGTCGPKECGDGRSCTIDTCDTANGACVHTHDLSTNTCLIDGVCYQTGAVNQANQCELCDPAAMTGGWTAKVCGAGPACSTPSCDSGTGMCTHVPLSGFCLIDGACYLEDAPNPDNACLICDPGKSQTAWSFKCSSGWGCLEGVCVQSVSGNITEESERGICASNGVTVHNSPSNPHLFYHGGGPLLIGVRANSSGSGSLIDPFVSLHAGSFTYAQPCANWIASNDDGGCGLESLLSFAELGAGTYVAVVFDNRLDADFGTYQLTFGLGPTC